MVATRAQRELATLDLRRTTLAVEFAGECISSCFFPLPRPRREEKPILQQPASALCPSHIARSLPCQPGSVIKIRKSGSTAPQSVEVLLEIPRCISCSLSMHPCLQPLQHCGQQ